MDVNSETSTALAVLVVFIRELFAYIKNQQKNDVEHQLRLINEKIEALRQNYPGELKDLQDGINSGKIDLKVILELLREHRS